MSGIQNFLTPLIFANRDKVIVLLGALLAWSILWLLIHRWRNERLHRDLAAARSGGSSGGGRRYATNAPVEEAPVESGALPPVKGGRTYARNLGTALQKAGMAPQIYSPPSPPGWASNTNPSQPGGGQPGPPYAPQNVPWAAPAAPQGSPWGGYPAGAGRGMPGPPPSPVPFYQPQQAPPQPMSQPIAPPPGVPGPFAPPVGSPFGPPAFSPATSGPPAPAPSFAPPAFPGAPPAAPAFGGNLPAVEPAAAEQAAGDAMRRGKPKRRRFNFNVLENLEKMVQSKIAEPAPPTGWTPPASPIPPATWTPPPSTAWTPPASAPAAVPAPPAPAAPAVPAAPEPTATAEPTPAAEVSAPAEEVPTVADFLPLRFGPEVPAETEEVPASVEKEPEPEPEAAAVSEAEAPVVEPEPQPEAEPEPSHEARGSMRSMLFGEESVSTHDAVPAAEPAASEPEPVAAEQPWGEHASVPEPITEAAESEKTHPWTPAPSWELEPQPEEVAATTEPGDGSHVPSTPVGDGGGGPSAGTVVIIEDDPAAATYYATLFKGNGYHVEVANDGVSGVDLCTRLQPQLIMLDVMMPRQNGILVLQTLRASDETKNTPVVVMSNFSEPTLIKRAIQLGALEYVIKTQVEGPALLNALPRWMNHEKAFAAA